MSKPRRSQGQGVRPAQPGAAASQAARRRRWLWCGLLLSALVLWAALQRLGSLRSVDLPAIASAGLDPQVARLIQTTLAEVRAAPRSGAAWGKLGMVLQHYEYKSEARRCFAQAVRLEPKDPRWPYFEGQLFALEDLGEAIPKLRQAALLSGEAVDAPCLRLAQALRDVHRFDEAQQEYEKLARRRADHPMALLGLAELRATQGQSQEAARLLERCLSDPHTAQKAHRLLASIERRLGNASAAQAAADRVSRLPRDFDWPDPFAAQAAEYRVGLKAWSDQAEALLEQGRAREALPMIQRAVKEYPQAADAWLILARARMSEQDCAGAQEALRQHLALDAQSINGHAELGVASLCLEQYEEAALALSKAVELKPDFGSAHFNLGFALARLNKATEAMAAFRQAIRYSPEFIDPYITLADLLNQTGQKREAMAYLRQALQLDPTDERARTLLQRVQ